MFHWKRFFMVATLSMLVAFAVSCAGAQDATPHETPSSIPATGSTPAPDSAAGGTAEFDQMFIDMMVPHHEGALEMAKIAQERGEHAEIKTMAEAILVAQAAEIEQMKDWRQAWYGSSQTPPMSAMPMLQAMPEMGGMGHTMDMAADVEELRKAPEPFDKAFIEAMIEHHQSAIDTAKLAQQQAARTELKTMADEIIAAQQAEIDQMKAWLAEWYP